MHVLRKYLITAAVTGGIALAGALGATGVSAAAESTTAVETAAQAAPQPGHIAVRRQNVVFSEYGGPTSIGSTAEEVIYAHCQANGIWGWYTYAWVPSLNSWGWLRNGDITGLTGPIWWLDLC